MSKYKWMDEISFKIMFQYLRRYFGRVKSVNGQYPDSNGAVTISLFTLDKVYPVGSIYMNYNDSRNPAEIFNFGTWERIGSGTCLIDAGGGYNAGTAVGSNTKSIAIANMPAHNHSVSVNSGGAHTHDRGTMDITGSFSTEALTSYGATGCPTPTGAFYITGSNHKHIGAYVGGSNYIINFNAARNWTGNTGTGGGHTHSVNQSNVGSGSPLNVMQLSMPVYMWRRVA